MLEELLSYTWVQMMESDYMYTSNNQKHVIQISGEELDDTRDSTILVYYNVYTQTPMICVYHVDGEEEFTPEIVPGFQVVKESKVNEDGVPYTEVVYLEDTMQKALS